MKFWFAVLLAFGLVLTMGCIGPDRPPVSEIEPPEWEVGQEWHYKGSNGQWRNWTVADVEERRGYETYRVQINLSSPDNFGRSVYIRWVDQSTLGLVENQNGETRNVSGASWGWSSEPMPVRFPLREGSTAFSSNVTLYVENERYERQVDEVVHVEGWTTLGVGEGERDVIHVRKVNVNTNATSDFWYDPNVGHWARYTTVSEALTFNLISWIEPE